MSNIRETNLRLTVRIPGLRIQPLDQEKSRSVLINHFAERSDSDALKKTLTITHDFLHTLRVLACLVGLYSYLYTHENSRKLTIFFVPYGS